MRSGNGVCENRVQNMPWLVVEYRDVGGEDDVTIVGCFDDKDQAEAYAERQANKPRRYRYHVRRIPYGEDIRYCL